MHAPIFAASPGPVAGLAPPAHILFLITFWSRTIPGLATGPVIGGIRAAIGVFAIHLWQTASCGLCTVAGLAPPAHTSFSMTFYSCTIPGLSTRPGIDGIRAAMGVFAIHLWRTVSPAVCNGMAATARHSSTHFYFEDTWELADVRPGCNCSSGCTLFCWVYRVYTQKAIAHNRLTDNCIKHSTRSGSTEQRASSASRKGGGVVAVQRWSRTSGFADQRKRSTVDHGIHLGFYKRSLSLTPRSMTVASHASSDCCGLMQLINILSPRT